MKKGQLLQGDEPNWYRGRKTQNFGDYYGSLASLARGEIYLTHDKMYIVHRNEEGTVSVRRNACAHAGAQILDKPGVQNGGMLRCPIHKWTYRPSGELVAAPHVEVCKNISLPPQEFGMWAGYLLGYRQEELHAALANFGKEVSLGGGGGYLATYEFEFMREVVYELPYPRPLMMVNYLDGYHVPLYHQKTFDAVADPNAYEWEFGGAHEPGGRCSYSIQVVRARNDVRKHADRLMKIHGCAETEFGWAHLHEWVKEEMSNIPTPIDRDIFAVWASIYGNGYFMPELYEGGLFLAVSYLVSEDGEDSETENFNLVEYYIHKNVPEELRAIAFRKFQEAYEQSAREDDEICLKLWEAHRRPNMKFSRVCHELLEAGDTHYREWFLRHFVQE